MELPLVEEEEGVPDARWRVILSCSVSWSIIKLDGLRDMSFSLLSFIPRELA